VSGLNLKPPFPTITVCMELEELAVVDAAAAATEAEVLESLLP